jgi:hypothetical protein
LSVQLPAGVAVTVIVAAVAYVGIELCAKAAYEYFVPGVRPGLVAVSVAPEVLTTRVPLVGDAGGVGPTARLTITPANVAPLGLVHESEIEDPVFPLTRRLVTGPGGAVSIVNVLVPLTPVLSAVSVWLACAAYVPSPRALLAGTDHAPALTAAVRVCVGVPLAEVPEYT